MNVIDCFNDTEFVQLICQSGDDYKTGCTCKKSSNCGDISFDIKIDELFENLNISEIINANETDNWDNGKPERVNDCFALNDGFDWICKTHSRNWNITQCKCISASSKLGDTMGDIATFSLYSGLENFTFPIYQEPQNSSIIDSKCIKYVYTEIIDHKNLAKHLISNIFLFIFLSILFLSLAYWIFKDKTYRKCFAREDDAIQLILEEELEAQL